MPVILMRLFLCRKCGSGKLSHFTQLLGTNFVFRNIFFSIQKYCHVIDSDTCQRRLERAKKSNLEVIRTLSANILILSASKWNILIYSFN